MSEDFEIGYSSTIGRRRYFFKYSDEAQWAECIFYGLDTDDNDAFEKELNKRNITWVHY
jgi:hypothetical protein